ELADVDRRGGARARDAAGRRGPVDAVEADRLQRILAARVAADRWRRSAVANRKVEARQLAGRSGALVGALLGAVELTGADHRRQLAAARERCDHDRPSVQAHPESLPSERIAD